MEIQKMYDLCIVGSGLIGSSAARHASINQGCAVCVIGPPEPKDRHSTDIFGAWYDEGRITRSTASDTLWALLASRSIQRYRDIEKQSGIKFYEEVGCLTVSKEKSEFLDNTYQSALAQKIKVLNLDANATRERYPYLQLFDGAGSVLELQEAGYVNPRLMREAQLTVARNQGCDVIEDIVATVEETKTEDGKPLMKVKTDGGRVVKARKVLIAVGSFVGFRKLLPSHIIPHIISKGQTVIFAELGKEDQERLRGMPSIIYKDDAYNFGLSSETDKYNCYILPPIKYPDGNTYIKLGCSTLDTSIEPILEGDKAIRTFYEKEASNSIRHHLSFVLLNRIKGRIYLKLGHGAQFEGLFNNMNDLQSWYTKQAPKMISEGLNEMINGIYRGIKPLSLYTDTCVTSHTPTRRPYVDLISPTLGVALGGNGYAAKSSDELGKVAVDYILQENWSYDLPKEKFRLVTKSPFSKL